MDDEGHVFHEIFILVMDVNGDIANKHKVETLSVAFKGNIKN